MAARVPTFVLMNAHLAFPDLEADAPRQRARCPRTGRFVAWAKVARIVARVAPVTSTAAPAPVVVVAPVAVIVPARVSPVTVRAQVAAPAPSVVVAPVAPLAQVEGGRVAPVASPARAEGGRVARWVRRVRRVVAVVAVVAVAVALIAGAIEKAGPSHPLPSAARRWAM